jgi:hypothetical protein
VLHLLWDLIMSWVKDKGKPQAKVWFAKSGSDQEEVWEASTVVHCL